MQDKEGIDTLLFDHLFTFRFYACCYYEASTSRDTCCWRNIYS
jgi:hypothetical protein